MAKFKKGQSGNPTGRPKGAPNKLTSIRDVFIEALPKMGGVDGLVRWAKKSNANQRLYWKILASLAPKQLQADVDLDVRFRWDGEDEKDNDPV